MISVLAVSIGFLVGGTLIVEQVYAPGIGQLMINAILRATSRSSRPWRSSSRSWWCSSTCWPTSRTRCSIREFGSTDDDSRDHPRGPPPSSTGAASGVAGIGRRRSSPVSPSSAS